jgi:beta-glucosidase
VTSDATVSDTVFSLFLHGGNVIPGVPPYKPPPGPPGGGTGNHSHPSSNATTGPKLVGARFWLDGKLLIDKWTPSEHHAGPSSARASLLPGVPRRVVVEYWIKDALGSQPDFRLQWDQAPPSLGGRAGIDQATAAAAEADATVVVVGGSQRSSTEGLDRAELSLPGTQQLELVKAVHAVVSANVSKKMIVIFVSGKPVAEPWIKDNVPAVVHSWQAGQAQGTAMARILFGLVNPSGKAAISTPVSSAVLPAYYSFKSSGAREGWLDCDLGGSSILWNFGHGLSYTSFEFSNLSIRNADPTRQHVIGPTDTVAVSCDVRNTGIRQGVEVVQVYVRDVVASVTTPHMALKGFARVSLEAGESQSVVMTIDVAEQLKILNRQWQWVVEPGLFQVMVGPASDNTPMYGNFSVTE